MFSHLLIGLFLSMAFCILAFAAEPPNNMLAQNSIKMNLNNNSRHRLDNNISPTHYDITIILSNDFVTLKKFTGTVKITIVLNEESAPSKSFRVHSENLNTGENKYKLYLNDDVQKINLIKSDTIEPETQTVLIELQNDKSIAHQKFYVLEVQYEGLLYSDMFGLYLSKYATQKSKEQWVLASQLQPTHARRVFPCFDEPSYKATFKLTVTCPNSYNVLSNSKMEKKTENFENESNTWIFKTTPEMSTYLFAIVVSQFSNITATQNNIDVTVWIPKEKSALAKFGLQATQEILAAMRNLTGINPVEHFGKIDEVVLPELMAEGMENWGIITYREAAFTFDNVESRALSKNIIFTLIAHELAHFWYGNMITLQWWDYAWLNEGFATYYEYRIPDELEPAWEISKQFVIDKHQAVLNLDSYKSSYDLNHQANTPQEIAEKFGPLTYSKGASIIRMMEHILGKEIFDEAMRAYLRNSKPSATPNDLWTIIAPYATNLPKGVTLTDIMKSYTDQPGLPVVTVKLLDANLELTQKRFLLDDERDNNLYYIPITFTTGDQLSFDKTTPQMWMKPTNQSLQIPLSDNNALVIVNIQETAYARINYDDQLWHRIITALKQENFGGIHVINRAQIVDDAMNLARAGLLSYTVALDVLSYLKDETDYYPWAAAYNVFGFLRQRFTRGTHEDRLLKMYILKLFERVYNTLQVTSHAMLLKKTVILSLASDLDEPYYLKVANQLYDRWIAQGYVIPPEDRLPTYCTKLRHSDSNTNWNILYDRFKTTQLQSEAQLILSALGCTQNEVLLTEYLKKTITPKSEIRSQDAILVFNSVVSSSDIGVNIGLAFVIDHHKDIITRYGSMGGLSLIVRSLVERFTLPEQVEKFNTFLDMNPTLPFHTEAKGLVQVANKNLRWTDTNKGDIVAFLEKHLNYSDSTTPPNGSSSVGNSARLLIFSMLVTLYLIRAW